jgi:hypothetical protein
MTTETLTRAPQATEAQETSGRVRTALWCTGTAAAVGGIAVGLIARDVAGGEPFAIFLVVIAAFLATATLALLAYITTSTRSAVGYLLQQLTAAIRKALDAHVATPLGQTAAEVARIRSIVRGTALGADDDTIPIGLRPPRPRAYASVAAVAGGQIQLIVDRHAELAGALADVRSEVAQIHGRLVGLPQLIEEQCAAAREEGRSTGQAEGYIEGVRERLKRGKRPGGEN